MFLKSGHFLGNVAILELIMMLCSSVYPAGVGVWGGEGISSW